jgi:plastocyanin
VTAPTQARKAIAVPLAVVLPALAPAGASAVADVIKSTNNNEVDQPTYSSDEGDLVRFQHTGGGPHNVTSTQFSGGERLFSSDTISRGGVPGGLAFQPGDVSFVFLPEQSHDNARAFFEIHRASQTGPAYLGPYLDPRWDRPRIERALRAPPSP